MARTTDPSLRNTCVYCIFPRNHSTSGSFAGIMADLDRISSLGVDVIWLLPIHPIGKARRKGSLGSPYAISDYRAINPEYGTMDDFKTLIDAVHRKEMKLVIDVVYNHTSPDSLLHKVHPDWFQHDSNGEVGSRVEDWTDVIDLDYGIPELWDYQIETLKGWVMEGVDGFRCDVASLLPLSFWIEARDACAKVNPDTLWIAETVEEDFCTTIRRMGYSCLTDSEALRAFDLSYDYDVYPSWKEFIAGKLDLKSFQRRLKCQEAALGETDYKLRFIENHDQDRAARILENSGTLNQWIGYSLFAKGATLLYAGEEYAIKQRPGLFDADPIDWKEGESPEARRHCENIRQLISLKKDGIVRDGFYWIPDAPEGYLLAAYERRSPDGRLTGLRIGIFQMDQTSIQEIGLTDIWPELEGSQKLTEMISGTNLVLNHQGRLKPIDNTMIVDWGITL